MIKFYRPNPKNTGSFVSVSFAPKTSESGKVEDAFFLSFVGQTGWDTSTKTGSFKNSQKRLNVKISVSEAANIASAIGGSHSVSIYHDTGSVTKGSFFQIEGKGYGLKMEKEQDAFSVGFNHGDAELLKRFILRCLNSYFDHEISAKIESQKMWREKGSGSGGSSGQSRRTITRENQEPMFPDDIGDSTNNTGNSNDDDLDW